MQLNEVLSLGLLILGLTVFGAAMYTLKGIFQRDPPEDIKELQKRRAEEKAELNASLNELKEETEALKTAGDVALKRVNEAAKEVKQIEKEIAQIPEEAAKMTPEDIKEEYKKRGFETKDF